MKNNFILPALMLVAIAATIMVAMTNLSYLIPLVLGWLVFAPLMRYWSRAGFQNVWALNTERQRITDYFFFIIAGVVFIGTLGFGLAPAPVYLLVALYAGIRRYGVQGYDLTYPDDGKKYWRCPSADMSGDTSSIILSEGIAAEYSPTAYPLWFPFSYLLWRKEAGPFGGRG
jgi:hypothetical protein